MPRKQPILYCTFANDSQSPLPNLAREYNEIRQILQSSEALYTYRTECHTHASLSTVFTTLQQFHQQITLFHFAGHAGKDFLILEEDGEAVVQAEGLQTLLKDEANLKIVFLNGCATQGQVEKLLELGIPAVIATSVSINDEKATNFAINFYTSFTKGKSILESFEAAKGVLLGKESTRQTEFLPDNLTRDRSLFLRERPSKQSFPWGVYFREERRDEIENLRLERLAVDLQTTVLPEGEVSKNSIQDLPQEEVFPIVILSALENQLIDLPQEVPTSRYGQNLMDWQPFGEEGVGPIGDILLEYQRRSGYPIHRIFLGPCALDTSAKAQLDQDRSKLAFIIDCCALPSFHGQARVWLEKINSVNVGGCLVPICKTYSGSLQAYLSAKREDYLDSLGYFFRNLEEPYVHIELEVIDKWTLFRRLNTIAYFRFRLKVPKRVNRGNNPDLPNVGNIGTDL